MLGYEDVTEKKIGKRQYQPRGPVIGMHLTLESCLIKTVQEVIMEKSMVCYAFQDKSLSHPGKLQVQKDQSHSRIHSLF